MLSNEAKAKRSAYQRDYYRRNRETLLANQREWRKNNPDKVQEYNKRYWENKSNAGVE